MFSKWLWQYNLFNIIRSFFIETTPKHYLKRLFYLNLMEFIHNERMKNTHNSLYLMIPFVAIPSQLPFHRFLSFKTIVAPLPQPLSRHRRRR